MGVDYYTCDVCHQVYCEGDNCGSCQGCERSWCPSCFHDVRTWVMGVNDEEWRCDLCWQDAPAPATDGELLQFLLAKHGIERSALEQEWAQTQSAARMRYDHYRCAGHCETTECLSLDQEAEDPSLREYGDGQTSKRRGRCCQLWYPEDDREWCIWCAERGTKTKRAKTKGEK